MGRSISNNPGGFMAEEIHGKLESDGASKELYSLFGYVVIRSSFGEESMVQLRCPPSLPPNESPLDWAEWNWEVYSSTRHCYNQLNSSSSRGSNQADGFIGEDDERSIAPR